MYLVSYGVYIQNVICQDRRTAERLAVRFMEEHDSKGRRRRGDDPPTHRANGDDVEPDDLEESDDLEDDDEPTHRRAYTGMIATASPIEEVEARPLLGRIVYLDPATGFRKLIAAFGKHYGTRELKTIEGRPVPAMEEVAAVKPIHPEHQPERLRELLEAAFQRRVSYPYGELRKAIARAAGKAPGSVSLHITKAVEQGLLVRVTGAKKTDTRYYLPN